MTWGRGWQSLETQPWTLPLVHTKKEYILSSENKNTTSGALNLISILRPLFALPCVLDLTSELKIQEPVGFKMRQHPNCQVHYQHFMITIFSKCKIELHAQCQEVRVSKGRRLMEES